MIQGRWHKVRPQSDQRDRCSRQVAGVRDACREYGANEMRDQGSVHLGLCL